MLFPQSDLNYFSMHQCPLWFESFEIFPSFPILIWITPVCFCAHSDMDHLILSSVPILKWIIPVCAFLPLPPPPPTPILICIYKPLPPPTPPHPTPILICIYKLPPAPFLSAYISLCQPHPTQFWSAYNISCNEAEWRSSRFAFVDNSQSDWFALVCACVCVYIYIRTYVPMTTSAVVGAVGNMLHAKNLSVSSCLQVSCETPSRPSTPFPPWTASCGSSAATSGSCSRSTVTVERWACSWCARNAATDD